MYGVLEEHCTAPVDGAEFLLAGSEGSRDGVERSGAIWLCLGLGERSLRRVGKVRRPEGEMLSIRNSLPDGSCITGTFKNSND